jgi:LysM repeat protein
MRLTRRGRVLLTGLAVVVLLVVFSLGRATSQASSSHKSAARPTVVVQAGETLWQLAQRVAPAADPRVTVERIMRLNDVHRADQVRPGQQIVLPG